MNRRIFPILTTGLCLGALTLLPSRGQSPAPIVVQAITPAQAAPAATVAPPPPAAAAADVKATVQILQEMQATNAATLKKQEATLEALDALQQAADELKIFSKRG